jgi:perosamine synthetase
MIPRLRPAIGPTDLLAAALPRHDVGDFERAFAQTMQQSHAVAFPYGRTGLLMLLQALGLKDREIVCPAYTCVVVAHAIVLSGNRPVFVDCEADGFNMDLVAAEAHITERTGAIIATSIHGYPVDCDKLAAITKRHPEITVIQDCAHSFSANWRGQPVNKAGTAAIFGLNISKLMTSIFGGMITTDDTALAATLRKMRDAQIKPGNLRRSIMRSVYLLASTTALNPIMFGIVYRLNKSGWLDHFTRYYDEQRIDMPSDYMEGMSRSEASLGVRQLERYPSIISHRRKTASLYDQRLSGVEAITRPPIVEGATYSHYVARVDDPLGLGETMASKGVEIGRLIDYCIPDMPAYADYCGSTQSFRNCRSLNAGVVNLPLHVDADNAHKISALLMESLR